MFAAKWGYSAITVSGDESSQDPDLNDFAMFTKTDEIFQECFGQAEKKPWPKPFKSKRRF